MNRRFKVVIFALPFLLFLLFPFKSVYAVLEPTMVKDIYVGANHSHPSNYGGKIDNIFFFIARNVTNGYELWKTDGTESETVMIKDIYPGTSSGTHSWDIITALGDIILFRATNGVNGWELWKSDGTEAGTTMVKDINEGPNSSIPDYYTYLGNTIIGGNTFYFSANNGTSGKELWKTDGTEAGTVMVKDINAGVSNSSPSYLTAVGTTLYFSANDGVHGEELWKTDGTEAGTVMVKDINVGVSNSSPSYLTAVGTTLYFGAHDGTHGVELWTSDGTEAGTVLVKDIYAGINNGIESVPHFTPIIDTIYFSAVDGVHGEELWKSDGTEAGTILVKDIDPGTWNGIPANSEFITIEDSLYFTAQEDIYGWELWKSDGTEAGTVIVKDINPGNNDCEPRYLTTIGSSIFFYAYDGTYEKLWISDGTETGTHVIQGEYDSPRYPSAFDEILYFGAWDSIHGVELWKLDIDIHPPVGNININSNFEPTISTSVSLTLNATDTLSEITEMILCDNESFTDCNWEPYSTTKSWTLTNTSGTKTIYVKYKDSEGNISEIYSDSIELRILPITFGSIVTNIDTIQSPSNTEKELIFTQIGIGSITFPPGLDLVSNYNQLTALGENLIVIYEPPLNRFRAFINSTGASFLATNGATIKFFNVRNQLGIEGLTESNYKTLLKVNVLDDSKNIVSDTSSFYDWNNATYSSTSDILTMPVNHFSEYVLGVNTGVLPSTGMSPYTLLIPSGLLLIGLGIVVISRKKKEEF